MPSSRSRERFAPEEAMKVLRQTTIERVDRAVEFPRGSSRSPKLIVHSGSQRWLVKRRAPAHAAPDRVQFCQHFQQLLHESEVPVTPPLAFRNGATALEIDGHCYEYFDFIDGIRYSREPEHALAAGEALGRLVRAASRSAPRGDSVHGTFHASGVILGAVGMAPQSILRLEPGADPVKLERSAQSIRRIYRSAADRAIASGFIAIGTQPIHGDYHPGNLLFSEHAVEAIVDFDTARVEPRAVEIANALLQLGSRRLHGHDVAAWPDDLDPLQIASMTAGMRNSGLRLESQEREAIPWLMIEACIAEGIVPIARTGAFADLRGSEMLRFIERRAVWLQANAARTLEALSL